ncbi:hypothetical protein [Hydrogenimonas sp.]
MRLKRMKNLFFLGLANLLPGFSFVDAHRWRLFKQSGMNIVGPCTIYGPITLHNFSATHNIYIGKNVFINTEVRFACTTSKISIIKDNIEIGLHASFETSGYTIEYVDSKKRSIVDTIPITVKRIWISACITLLLYISISKYTAIAAAIVVNKDVLPQTIHGGISAWLIKKI